MLGNEEGKEKWVFKKKKNIRKSNKFALKTLYLYLPEKNLNKSP